MGSVQGKVYQVKVNGLPIACQTDATLNTVTNTTEKELCKPTGAESNAVTWVEYNVDSQGWDISFSGQAFADSLVNANANLLSLFIAGDVLVEVDFHTNVDVKGFDGNQIQFYSGTGIMTAITLNAPTTGVATYDVTIQGTGALTELLTPITT